MHFSGIFHALMVEVHDQSKRDAFTLVEIMIVVVIIGLIAAMAIPGFEKAREDTMHTRFANDCRVYSQLMKASILETGDWPEDSNSGVLPSELVGYISLTDWNKGPSIGGVWDVEKNDSGVVSAIGSHRFNTTPESLERFDEAYDDAALDTGRFRLLAGDRYYFIVQE